MHNTQQMLPLFNDATHQGAIPAACKMPVSFGNIWYSLALFFVPEDTACQCGHKDVYQFQVSRIMFQDFIFQHVCISEREITSRIFQPRCKTLKNKKSKYSRSDNRISEVSKKSFFIHNLSFQLPEADNAVNTHIITLWRRIASVNAMIKHCLKRAWYTLHVCRHS